jgi:hypothetical protein
MSDLDTRLEQALTADSPGPRDPMFRIAVMMRREQAALRRRIVAASALAFGAAILAAVGYAMTQALPNGGERLAALAAIGTVLTSVLVAPYLGGAAALRGLVAQASQTVRSVRAPRLWF